MHGSYNQTLTTLHLYSLSYLDLWRSAGYLWPPIPLKVKVEHTIIWEDNTLFSSANSSEPHSPSQCLHEHRCHFNRGRTEVTRKWPVGEPKSRWGLSVFNLKLVSGLRNGCYNHICSWAPINSTSSHETAVEGNMKLTIPGQVSGHLAKLTVSLKTV